MSYTEKSYQMDNNEKKLLNIIGRHPEITIKELLTHTTYKCTRTVKRKLTQLKEQRILYGPYYDINYSKLCKNPLHKLYCILESTEDYETVISYLQLIDSIRAVFPTVSSYRKVLTTLFYSSHDAEVISILQLLKDSGIITDYIVHTWCSRRMIENPNLFGDSNPSLHSLLDPCDIPDIGLEHHDTAWNTCDIAILPYLRKGLEGGKLTEILKVEKKFNKRWTYEQVKYSREKMVKNGLIKKIYTIRPFPHSQCAQFDLFLKPEDSNLTRRILYNFAKGERIYKEYVLCEDGGFIFCVSHPLFLTDLMRTLDEIDAVFETEIYPIRTFPYRGYVVGQFPELKYFNFDSQTLEYPYCVYKEKIKEKIEGEVIFPR